CAFFYLCKFFYYKITLTLVLKLTNKQRIHNSYCQGTRNSLFYFFFDKPQRKKYSFFYHAFDLYSIAFFGQNGEYFQPERPIEIQINQAKLDRSLKANLCHLKGRVSCDCEKSVEVKVTRGPLIFLENEALHVLIVLALDPSDDISIVWQTKKIFNGKLKVCVMFGVRDLQKKSDCVKKETNNNKKNCCYCRYQCSILEKNPVVDEKNKPLIIETLRQIAELMIWGDQNNDNFFLFKKK
ncbi:hypothetical protein RFI_23394, partial [Reticulomyxa filosa]